MDLPFTAVIADTSKNLSNPPNTLEDFITVTLKRGERNISAAIC